MRWLLLFLFAASATAQLNSIGQPTAEEQFYLELINRARRDPGDEGQRLLALDHPRVRYELDLFDVDLTMFATEMGTLDPAPPLAMNAVLLSTARGHSQDIATNGVGFDPHTGSDGVSAQGRIASSGYDLSGLGPRYWQENVYPWAVDAEHGHAAFEFDWGRGGDGGMQFMRGHRANIHSPLFREVGVGVVVPAGRQIVTQDFGRKRTPHDVPLITGVAYQDRDGNGFYSPGEGIGGIEIRVADGSYYATTAGSGGYAVPVSGDGAYEVRFERGGQQIGSATAKIQNGNNAKADLVWFTGPVIPSRLRGVRIINL